jgi:cytoskeletal protein CcmA (bactofilin family)
MASIIRIKRSGTSGNPSTLGAGELAYSALTDNGSNGGDRLYIGMGTETAGNAVNHVVIGGKFFTDMLDHNKGTLTASSAIITDVDSKIDNLLVDNLQLNGNTLSTTNTNGDLLITPNGTGKTVVTNLYIGDNNTSLTEFIYDAVGGTITAGTGITSNVSDASNTTTLSITNTGVTAGSYGSATAIPTFTVNAQGQLTAAGTAALATTLNIAGDTGTDGVALLSDTLTFAGTNGLSAAVTNNAVTITSNATSANTALAIVKRDASGNFSAGTINAALAGNASTATTLQTARTITLSGDVAGSVSFNGSSDVTITATIQADSVALGSDTTGNYVATIAGTANQVNVSGSGTETAAVTLSLPQNIHSGATPAFAGMSLSGNLAMGSNTITGLADPVNAQDAATKAYVDAARAGLDVKQSVRAATTGNITLSNTQTVDGVALVVGDRVLVKDQTTGSQNGIYVVSSGAWSRASDADAPNEVSPGLFLFVEEGTLNGDNGFVITSDAPLTVGTDAIIFTQFSGAGQIVAGNALTKSGNTLDVVVAGSGGIEIVSDALQLKSSLAGAGLVYGSGVLDVVGTANRITVNSDSIDIASTYVGQSSITTLGTVTTGVWNATIVSPTYGGTGVNNGSKTITLGGNLTTAGAYSTILTMTGATSIILPTTGTLATLAGAESLTNKTIDASNIGATTRGSGAFTTLAANGAATLTSTLTVSGATTLNSTLGVSGNVTVAANITGAGAATSTLDGFNIDGGTY